MDYTITLTDTETKAMECIAKDVQEWITNVTTNRARIAVEEIIKLNTEHCNANSIQLAVGIDAQVQQAYDLGVVVELANVSIADSPAP